jgi:hypothetical protein
VLRTKGRDAALFKASSIGYPREKSQELRTEGPGMKTSLLVALSMVVLLGACASRLNPFNWFGRSAPVEQVLLTEGETVDPRALVDEVLSLTIEPFPGGAIVRAEGRTPTQGWWEAELVARPIEKEGVLIYDFRLLPPIERTNVSTPQSRQIAVAVSLSDIKLEGIREVIVQGARNARAVRR